jgi:5-methylcytosine-specific restriction protein A
MRDVPEWIGKDDNAMPPASVVRRIYEQQERRCPICTRELQPGKIVREHWKPIWAGGANRESNLRLVCTIPCARDKTRGEAKQRAKADRCLTKHLGLKPPKKRSGVHRAPKRRPMPGTKASGWKHKLDGTWERRER